MKEKEKVLKKKPTPPKLIIYEVGKTKDFKDVKRKEINTLLKS